MVKEILGTSMMYVILNVYPTKAKILEAPAVETVESVTSNDTRTTVILRNFLKLRHDGPLCEFHPFCPTGKRRCVPCGSCWFLLVPAGWMEGGGSFTVPLLQATVYCTVLLNTIELNTQACHKVYSTSMSVQRDDEIQPFAPSLDLRLR